MILPAAPYHPPRITSLQDHRLKFACHSAAALYAISIPISSMRDINTTIHTSRLACEGEVSVLQVEKIFHCFFPTLKARKAGFSLPHRKARVPHHVVVYLGTAEQPGSGLRRVDQRISCKMEGLAVIDFSGGLQALQAETEI
ncbi:hypothetical protein ACO22_06321 [Paracoccidioides brasiliensis]|uniref:Uncharacterized protein n=1 Tax=Paracoccidioides brasiliensis TaxID=121759 RepID=A0A1D2J7W7_PARBR|nr:hypothetical protein ACO22_06321 [Paracoccidioides brasiliensis]